METAAARVKTILSPPPPGFPTGPAGDVSLQLLQDPLRFLLDMHAQYGSVVGLVLGGQRVVLVADPAIARDVLIDRATDVFVKEGTAFFPGSSLAGNGLLVSDGAIWRRQRQLTNPAFRTAALNGYIPAIHEATTAFLNTLPTTPTGAIRDVYADFNTLTLRVVLQSLFGASMQAHESHSITSAIETAFSFFAKRAATAFITPEWLPTPDNVQYNAAVQRLDEVVYRLIRERRQQYAMSQQYSMSDIGNAQQQGEQGELQQQQGEETQGGGKQDLLSALLTSVDDTGVGMSDIALRDELMTLLVAGQETSAILLGWTAALLAHHPVTQQRVVGELQRVLGGRLPTLDDMRHLVELQCVLLESLRVLPPAYMVGRCAACDTQLQSGSTTFDIPQGTTMLVAPYLLHRNPTVWPNPDRFHPQRWRDPLAKRAAAGGPAAMLPAMAMLTNMSPNDHFVPFGAGPRNCVGTGFAMMEVMVVLAGLLQGHVLRPAAEGACFPQPGALITLRPAAVELRVVPRG